MPTKEFMKFYKLTSFNGMSNLTGNWGSVGLVAACPVVPAVSTGLLGLVVPAVTVADWRGRLR